MHEISIDYDFNQVCRTCGSFGDLQSLFDSKNTTQNLPELIMECTSVQIDENDGFPPNICNDCIIQVKQAYAFKHRCEEVQQVFMYNRTCDLKVKIKEEILNTEWLLEESDKEPSEEDWPEEAGKDNLIELVENPPEDHVPTNDKVHPKLMKVCEVCNRIMSRKHYYTHKRLHTDKKPFTCPTCDKTFSFSANLSRHIKIHTGEKPFQCNHCGKRFIQSVQLKSHLRVHTNERPFQCNICGKAFKQSSNCTLHMQIHEARERKAPKGTYIKRKSSLQYNCNICNKGLSSKLCLKHHVMTHGEKKFLCSTCGKSFSTKAALDQHSIVHTNDRVYRCEICSKTFAYRSYLKIHMLKHTGEKPHACDICKKTFRQLPHLKTHMRLHNGEKPHACGVCGKSFALKGNLTVHLRIHTGETPFHCPICGKGFYDSSSMKKHQKAHFFKKSE